ncbi:MAG: GNAT family N-acetyltransferase [Alistipes sp.]|nr:GNAT family N-acetyltransferase [Alistipes sp.]
MKIDVMVATEEHLRFVTQINDSIDEAAKQRGTGIARRTDEYIADKINSGKAIIAVNRDELVGFCYIESWGHDEFVANSGLIVRPQYRGMGVAKRIKQAAFDLSRKRFPNAKLFGLTTGEAVMRINTALGYEPVTFAMLTDDEEFWKGCKSCVNYDVLQRTNMTKCLCTGMIYDPEKAARKKAEAEAAAAEQNKKKGSWLSRLFGNK